MIARILMQVQWRYVLPRLTIITLVMLIASLAVEPLLHRFFTGLGERIVRAKVDIEHVDVSFYGADLLLTDVAVANPRSLDRNLIECDYAKFDLVTTSVLQRRLRVREASLTGVRFNTKRSKSGEVELPPLGMDMPEDLDAKLKNLGSGALRQFARIMAQDLQEELLSIQLSQELAARWPDKYRELKERGTRFANRIKEIERELETLADDPQGMVTSFPEKLAEVDKLRAEVLAIAEEMDHISQLVARDREAIAIARRHDEEVLRRKLKLRELDPQQLSEYLLDDELAEKTREMLRWIRLARRYWPSDLEMPEAERSHGDDIVFPGLTPMPRAIIERLKVDGTVQNGPEVVAWRGEVLNLTTDPAVVGKPMVIRAETRGANPLVIEATLDRTTNVPRDRIVLSLPALEQPARTLGRPDQLAVGVPAGTMVVWAELNLEGEKLAGRMIVQQKDLRIQTQLSPQLGQRLATRVAQATEHVNSLEAEVKLSGTLDKPAWELRSNLGPQLATSLSAALQAELDSRREELSAKLTQYLANEETRIAALLADEQQQVVNITAAGTVEIEGLRRRVAGRIKVPSRGLLDDLTNPFFRR